MTFSGLVSTISWSPLWPERSFLRRGQFYIPVADEPLLQVSASHSVADDAGWQFPGHGLHFQQFILQLAQDSCLDPPGDGKSGGLATHRGAGSGFGAGAVLHLFGHPHSGLVVLYLDHDGTAVVVRTDLLDLLRFWPQLLGKGSKQAVNQ